MPVHEKLRIRVFFPVAFVVARRSGSREEELREVEVAEDVHAELEVVVLRGELGDSLGGA